MHDSLFCCRIFGVTTLDIVRANTFVAELKVSEFKMSADLEQGMEKSVPGVRQCLFDRRGAYFSMGGCVMHRGAIKWCQPGCCM